MMAAPGVKSIVNTLLIGSGGPTRCSTKRSSRNPNGRMTTTALKIEVELQPGFSAGILEWRVIYATDL